MPRHPDHLFSVDDVLLSTVQSDDVRVNIGDATSGVGFGAAQPMFGVDGFISVPMPPDANGGACQVVCLQDGDQKIAIATRDHRYQPKAGNSKPGDRMIVTPGGARIILKNDSGTITLETTDDNTESGNAVYLRVAPDSFSFHAPFGSIVFDATGLHFVTQSGATFDLGGVANPLAPNYCRINAAQVLVDSPRVNIGPTATNGGSGVFLAPVLAPLASAASGVPTPIGAGMGVVLGVTSTSVFFGA